MRVLSIDFDFWIPEDPMMDLGHVETSFYINLLWGIRLATYTGIQDRLNISKTETPSLQDFPFFLKERGFKIKKNQIAIAESHSSIAHYLRRDKDLEIVHIDAHHDFGYGQGETGKCGSWVPYLVNKGKIRRIHLIYPKWRKDNQFGEDWRKELDKKVKKWDTKGVEVKVDYGLENFPHDFHADKEFICRSGAWSPPWTDSVFVEMVAGLLLSQNHSSSGFYTHPNLSEFIRKIDVPLVVPAVAAPIMSQMKEHKVS